MSDYRFERLKEQVDKVLDLVERPVGTLKPRLPDTPDAQAALISLFDAIDRGL